MSKALEKLNDMKENAKDAMKDKVRAHMFKKLNGNINDLIKINKKLLDVNKDILEAVKDDR